MRPGGEQLRRIGGLVDAGTLKPHVDRIIPLAQTKEAVAYAESGRARGNVVIQVRG